MTHKNEHYPLKILKVEVIAIVDVEFIRGGENP